jgi:hypothetical protein
MKHPRGTQRLSLLAAAVTLPCLLGGFARDHARPSLFRIPLQPTNTAPSATGVAQLAPAQSPFGLALTPDGRFIFDVNLAAQGLPAPSAFGPYTQYVAWIASADLSSAERLGVVRNGAVTGQVAMDKYLVIVSAEGASVGDKWKGPVVLRGFSPSALLENFSGKTMFNGGMPQ